MHKMGAKIDTHCKISAGKVISDLVTWIHTQGDDQSAYQPGQKFEEGHHWSQSEDDGGR